VDASGIAGATSVNIAAANGDFSVLSPSLGIADSFSLGAPAGSDRVEVLAFNQASQNGLPLGEQTLVAARNFTNQSVPGVLNGGSAVQLGTQDQVTLQPITYNNVPSGFTAPTTLVAFEMGAGGAFTVTSGASDMYPSLPAPAVLSGDHYIYFSDSYALSLGGVGLSGQGVSVESSAPAAGPVAITFPTPWTYAGPKPAALPAFDFNYAGFSGKTGVMQAAGLEWSASSSGTLAEYDSMIFATANFQNGSTSVVFPNLSNLTGFLPAPVSGTRLVWSAQIMQTNGVAFQGSPSSNPSSATVINGGAFTVP
jgi:hypothetical protein